MESEQDIKKTVILLSHLILVGDFHYFHILLVEIRTMSHLTPEHYSLPIAVEAQFVYGFDVVVVVEVVQIVVVVVEVVHFVLELGRRVVVALAEVGEAKGFGKEENTEEENNKKGTDGDSV